MDTEPAAAEMADVRKRGKPSLRTCIVTRAELPPSDLIRFVPAPDGSVTPDLARKLPGRGVWVTCNAEVLREAIHSKAFAKSLKRKVIVAEDLPLQVEQLMIKRVIEALSLANKAGCLVTGFSKIDAELAHGNLVVLLHGREASADGSGKLDRKWRAVAADLGKIPHIVNELTIAQLDLATGKENVVHAGLSAGGATSRFSIEVERLGRYRLPSSSRARDAKAE
jgi:uncharacterized protein